MSLMDMVGAIVCRWKGAHKWTRPQKLTVERARLAGAMNVIEHKLCDRCGATRPVKPRARKANVAIAEGAE